MSVVVITGTDTGVGKTVATAALAGSARLAGRDVAVCKPVQTGTDTGDGELVELVRRTERPGRLVLVEGAGGLLVELGADGVTLRDLAAELGASVLVVVAAGLGTLNHTALTLEALAAQGIPCAGLVIGAWPHEPGVAEAGNRDALGRLAAVRAVLPAGAGAMSAAEFESMSASAFDPQWVTNLAG